MNIDLKQFGISRPEKIRWRFAVKNEDIFSAIKSSKLSKFLITSDDALKEKGITYEYKTLTKNDFLEWLPFYKEKMQELDYDVIADEEWFDKKKEQNFEVEGVFFYDSKHILVGSGIFTKKGTEKATFAFKATERIDLSSKSNSSLGAVIDFFFLREMHLQHMEIISGGVSRNAFGVINSLGYLDYKLRFGYEPTASPTAKIVEEVPTNEQGIVLFYGMKDSSFSLYAFKPKGTPATFEQARFATPEIPFVEVEY